MLGSSRAICRDVHVYRIFSGEGERGIFYIQFCYCSQMWSTLVYLVPFIQTILNYYILTASWWEGLCSSWGGGGGGGSGAPSVYTSLLVAGMALLDVERVKVQHCLALLYAMLNIAFQGNGIMCEVECKTTLRATRLKIAWHVDDNDNGRLFDLLTDRLTRSCTRTRERRMRC